MPQEEAGHGRSSTTWVPAERIGPEVTILSRDPLTARALAMALAGTSVAVAVLGCSGSPDSGNGGLLPYEPSNFACRLLDVEEVAETAQTSLGASPREMFGLVEGEHRGVLRYRGLAAGTNQDTNVLVTVELTEDPVLLVMQTNTDLGYPCETELQRRALVRLTSGDGSFRESFFTTVRAFEGPIVRSRADIAEGSLGGNFVRPFSVPPGHDLFYVMSLAAVAGEFRGTVSGQTSGSDESSMLYEVADFYADSGG